MPHYDAGLSKEVADDLLRKIQEAAQATNAPTHLLRLAEAYAWVIAPSASHGGSNATSPK